MYLMDRLFHLQSDGANCLLVTNNCDMSELKQLATGSAKNTFAHAVYFNESRTFLQCLVLDEILIIHWKRNWAINKWSEIYESKLANTEIDVWPFLSNLC